MIWGNSRILNTFHGIYPEFQKPPSLSNTWSFPFVFFFLGGSNFLRGWMALGLFTSGILNQEREQQGGKRERERERERERRRRQSLMTGNKKERQRQLLGFLFNFPRFWFWLISPPPSLFLFVLVFVFIFKDNNYPFKCNRNQRTCSNMLL